MNPLDSGTVFFSVYEDGGQRVRQQRLTDGEKLILRTMEEHGYPLDIFWAYMAETYPECPAAPRWRGSSGTHNGLLVSRFFKAVPNDPHGYHLWHQWMRERFFRQFSHLTAESSEGICVEAMAMALWVGQVVFMQHGAWEAFVDVSRRELRRKPSAEAARAGRICAVPPAA